MSSRRRRGGGTHRRLQRQLEVQRELESELDVLNIASFLDQSRYFQLQKVNRSFFVGCNWPNMLKELDLNEVKDYKSINLKQYRSLKKLGINIHKFNGLTLPKNGQFIMNELDELLLDAKEENDCDIEPFMNQNGINIENIKVLRLHNFGDMEPEKQFNFSKFWRLLTRFRNVEYLELYGIFPKLNDNNIDTNKWKELYPNLKGLIVNGGHDEINNRLINIFGNNLYFLEHYYGDIHLKKVDFPKLEQLVLTAPDNDTINNILKTARNLEKVYIDHDSSKQNEDELKTVIPQILKCKLLQYFEIETKNDKHFTAILDGIGFGLYQTKKWKRKQLTICINLYLESDIDIKRGIYNIGSVISTLESSEINDFIFICDLQNVRKQRLNKIDILNDLNDISSNIEVKADQFRFIITNKKCKINGWMESWMMEDM